MLTRRDFIKGLIAAGIGLAAGRVEAESDPRKWRWVEERETSRKANPHCLFYEQQHGMLWANMSHSIKMVFQEARRVIVEREVTKLSRFQMFEDGALIEDESMGDGFFSKRGPGHVVCPGKEYEFRLTSCADLNDAELLVEVWPEDGPYERRWVDVNDREPPAETDYIAWPPPVSVISQTFTEIEDGVFSVETEHRIGLHEPEPDVKIEIEEYEEEKLPGPAIRRVIDECDCPIEISVHYGDCDTRPECEDFRVEGAEGVLFVDSLDDWELEGDPEEVARIQRVLDSCDCAFDRCIATWDDPECDQCPFCFEWSESMFTGDIQSGAEVYYTCDMGNTWEAVRIKQPNVQGYPTVHWTWDVLVDNADVEQGYIDVDFNGKDTRIEL